MSDRRSTSVSGQQQHLSRRALPLLAVLGAAVCWSSLGISYELILNDVSVHPVTLVTIRATAASLFIGLALVGSGLHSHRTPFLPRSILSHVLALGLISVALFYVTLIYAYDEAGVAVGTVLLYLSPFFVALGGWVAFRTPVSRRQIATLMVAFAGVAAVALGAGAGGTVSPTGIGLGIISAVSYASFSLVVRPAIARAAPLLVIGSSLMVGTIALWIVKLVVDGTSLPRWEVVVIIALASGLGATVAPLLLYTWGLARIGPSRASLFASAEPVVAVVLAYWVLGERLTVLQALGAVAVLAGLLLSSLERYEESV